jgi:hypothetical protein
MKNNKIFAIPGCSCQLLIIVTYADVSEVKTAGKDDCR